MVRKIYGGYWEGKIMRRGALQLITGNQKMPLESDNDYGYPLTICVNFQALFLSKLRIQ